MAVTFFPSFGLELLASDTTTTCDFAFTTASDGDHSSLLLKLHEIKHARANEPTSAWGTFHNLGALPDGTVPAQGSCV
jgi:hypothetical protein